MVTQKYTGKNVRLRDDVWAAAKAEARRTRRSIAETLDYALRKTFKLPARVLEEDQEAA